MGWIDDDTFNFWLPIQSVLIKGGKKDGSDKEGRRWVQGIASTSSKDLQGEIVDQQGIDFGYFLKHGYFNNDHKPGFENKVGEPTECKLTKNGLWVKGFLYHDKKVAEDIWEMLHSLERSGSDRRIGFSIQGKVKRRQGHIIKECWIQDIAITPCPVNTTTWAEIAKSLSSQSWDFSKSEEDTEEAEKAMVAAGNSLVPESLEGKQKTSLQKSLTFEESVSWIENQTGMARETAEATARVIFSQLSRKE